MSIHPRRVRFVPSRAAVGASRLAGCSGLALGVLAGATWMAAPARAGGGPENALILIDPSSAESMYIGNYYKNARNIPDANVLYMDPDAANYTAFRAQNLVGLGGALANARTTDHIDYIVVTPGNSFYVSAPGLVSDGCFAISRFSISSAYTMAFITSDIVPPATPNQGLSNKYYAGSNVLSAFDSNVSYFSGTPSGASTARRYYIGAMLGYTGLNGNTVGDITALIDRSVAADNSRPAGTFYFMNNISDVARNVRANQFSAIISAMINFGANATQLNAELPLGQHDILGVVAGFAWAGIETPEMTIKPGAFCDHLTSWAATFDISSQAKVSSWIREGASGSAGEVEEPCNYTGKFPHSRLHVFYFLGASLGEAYLRSVSYTPFQGLLYGDPLTRAFTYIPTVTLTGLPGSDVSGPLSVTAQGSNSKPGTTVNAFELHVDGQRVASAGASGVLAFDTSALNDGWHDIRAIGFDSSSNKAQGRFVGGFTTNNHGKAATLGTSTPSGNLAGAYSFTLGSSGGAVAENRVLLNGRVVASRTSNGSVTVKGQNLGAGLLKLQGETIFADGTVARSAPVSVSIAYDPGTPSAVAPVAFSYTKHILNNQSAVVELPASFDTDPASATYSIVTNPTKATIVGGANAFRIITPIGSQCGTDTIQFNVQTANGTSNTGTVTLVYDKPASGCLADFNGDGFVNGDDFDGFVAAFEAGTITADFNNDCFVNGDDFDLYVARFESGC